MVVLCVSPYKHTRDTPMKKYTIIGCLVCFIIVIVLIGMFWLTPASSTAHSFARIKTVLFLQQMQDLVRGQRSTTLLEREASLLLSEAQRTQHPEQQAVLYRRAASILTHALREHPENAEALLLRRGVAYVQVGQFDAAIADYTAAIAQNPGGVFGYNNRGIAYRAKGDYCAALADFAVYLKRTRNTPLETQQRQRDLVLGYVQDINAELARTGQQCAAAE